MLFDLFTTFDGNGCIRSGDVSMFGRLEPGCCEFMKVSTPPSGSIPLEESCSLLIWSPNLLELGLLPDEFKSSLCSTKNN